MLESYLRGLGQDASMGYADEIAAGAESAAGSLGLVPDKTYEQSVQESRDSYKQAQQDNPKSYMAGEATGMAASMIVPGGAAKLALKGAKRLALERLAKSGIEAVGRSNGNGIGMEDVAGMALSAVPMGRMNKASKDIPWKMGKGVKLAEEAAPNLGKVRQVEDKLQEVMNSSGGKAYNVPSALERATNEFKGKAKNIASKMDNARVSLKGEVKNEMSPEEIMNVRKILGRDK